MNETESIVFYTFVLQQNLDVLFDEVKAFNNNQDSVSHVHLAVLGVEKYN
jgi:hypothetical protein